MCQKWTAGTLPAAGGDGSLVHTPPTGAVHVSANVGMGAVVATIDAAEQSAYCTTLDSASCQADHAAKHDTICSTINGS